MWHKTSEKLPKTMDYYLITDGTFYSVAVFSPSTKEFFDRNTGGNTIETENVKYWKKIPLLPFKHYLNRFRLFFR